MSSLYPQLTTCESAGMKGDRDIQAAVQSKLTLVDLALISAASFTALSVISVFSPIAAVLLGAGVLLLAVVRLIVLKT